MKLKLVDLDTGEEVKPDTNNKLIIKRTYPHGVKAGELFPFGELIAPTEQHPQGIVRGKKEESGLGWVEYYPEVFNARIVES